MLLYYWICYSRAERTVHTPFERTYSQEKFEPIWAEESIHFPLSSSHRMFNCSFSLSIFCYQNAIKIIILLIFAFHLVRPELVLLLAHHHLAQLPLNQGAAVQIPAEAVGVADAVPLNQKYLFFCNTLYFWGTLFNLA